MSPERAELLTVATPAPAEGRLARLYDCIGLVALFALFLLLRPLQNAPFIDDGAFAWSVQWLLDHGQFRVLEYSHINPVQTVWGSLFCLPFGVSFTALRLSTWVLGASTLCGLYLTLREMDVPRRYALAGAAALAVNPIFVILSCSYMTDVPLVAMATWGSYCLILAVRRRSDRWLWMSAFFSACACGIRIPGAVLPIATGCVLLLHTGRWGRRPDRLLAAGMPLALFVLLMLASPRLTVETVDVSHMKNSVDGRLYLLGYAVRSFPTTSLVTLLFVASMAGASLLPLALGGIGRPTLRRGGIVLLALLLGCLILLAFKRQPFQPLSVGQTWELTELGATSDLVAGRERPVYPASAMLPILLVSLVSGAVVLACGFWRRSVLGESAFRWQVVGHFLLVGILWLDYDRYILPFLPPLIVLMLVGLPRLRIAPYVTGIVVLAGVSVAGLHDQLAYNRALWGAVDTLRQQGVPVSAIDAGYSVNLWQHYAHPADAPRGVDGLKFVPHMTSRRSLEYRIANAPMPGFTVQQTVPISRWMGRDLSLYILRQVPGTAVPDPDKATEKW